VTYFRSVYESLGEGGLFFQDFYGGSETMEEREDERTCELPNGGKFTYIWDQHRFKPVTGEVECRIHFKFRDGSKMQNAFVYHWRLWTLPEIQELLAEAGFSKTTVYWEGDELDDDGEPTGEGNGEYTPRPRATPTRRSSATSSARSSAAAGGPAGIGGPALVVHPDP
jgi:hypothetical protein